MNWQKRRLPPVHMIVYTSADSVLQICGNEETFGLDELYRCCENRQRADHEG